MNKKKIILIDLDHTLIDTEKLWIHYNRLLRQFGISRHDSTVAYKKTTKKGIFHPRSHLRHLTTDKNKAYQIMEQYERTIYIKKKRYNFYGIDTFLKKLSGHYDLMLLTYGHREYQLKKFNQMDLQHLFKDTVITNQPHKKKELLRFFKKYRDNVLLLDDSKLVIATAREVGVKAIKIKRGKKDGAYYRKILKRIKTIHE